MAINLSRGFWRMWLFLGLVWVVFCAWHVLDARYQVRKATELRTYYIRQNAEAQRFNGAGDITPLVIEHISEQVKLNDKIIEAQTARDHTYTRLSWLVLLISLVFARGIPWVWEGFLKS